MNWFYYIINQLDKKKYTSQMLFFLMVLVQTLIIFCIFTTEFHHKQNRIYNMKVKFSLNIFFFLSLLPSLLNEDNFKIILIFISVYFLNMHHLKLF